MSTKSPEPDAAESTIDLTATSTDNAEAAEPLRAAKKDAEPTCGLDGCDEPLPPRPRDELGRPKGGRRARYCSKAHADAASRQRRANDLAAVADPLALAREATAGVLPVARQLSDQLNALMTRFEQAETGALARVQAAEAEAGEAHAEAARAAEGEQQAEQARREALAEARKNKEAKDQALKRAEQAHTETERIRDEAWKQVADHERARGQAEAELGTLREALERLRREHAELLDTAQDQRTRITQLDLQLATTTLELRQAGERTADLNTRLAHDEQRHHDTVTQLQARHDEQIQQLQQARETALAEVRALKLNTQDKPPAPLAPRTPKPARRRPRVAGNRQPDRTRPQSPES
ncbi:coiled-coil domain-containing protein [Kineosporia babensis]|uniref:Chromosome segregation ATPase n=1 Tax=Kineosporia babensis TaxID=499548 RepID=A0A9X1NKS5_9ACTN|nr:hypothetical protein [Kineosporia babensis]MCD5315905.1 hypothetical protein [Kineosporia babensis]